MAGMGADSRTSLIDYAERHQIPVAKDKRGEAPFSTDANLLHISAEGKALEDPWHEPEEFVYSRTVAPEAGARQARLCRDRIFKGRRSGGGRQEAFAGGAADQIE